MADQKHVVSIVVATCDTESASVITSKLINEDFTMEANKIWTVKRGVKLQKEPQTSMSRLKEYDDASMDYDDLDLNVDGNTGKRPHRLGSYESENELHKMKRLKSFSDQGTSISSDHSQAAQQILADIHIIIKPPAMSNISSFVFPNCKAGILVVPCDSRKFDQDKEILINSVKEIGHYWKKDAFTHLVIVNMPSQERSQTSENEKTRNKFSSQIRSLLYGTHFDHRVEFCDSDGLLKTIYEKVSKCIEFYPSLTEQDVNALDVYNRKENGQFFVEASEIEPHVTNAKAILQERNIGFVQNSFYKKEEVFNAFQCFIEDFHSAEQYLELAEFYERFDSTLPELSSQSRMLLDAFCALGLTNVCPNKHVYILPLMVSTGNKETFDKFGDFSPESNQLRITFNSDTMPVALKAKILMACLTNSWIVYSFRPSISNLGDTYFARKGNFGLCLTFETSDAKCYVYLQMSRDHKTGNLEKECEKTRNMITEILGEKCQNYVTRKQDKPPFDYSDEVDWKNVDDLLSSKRCLYKGGNHLLKYWFSTEEKFKVGAEVNAGTIDSFLAELAKLFGSGYYLFFVEQSIPSELIDRLRETNITIERLVYCLLKEWWQKKELKQEASVSALRDAVVNDTSLKISIHKFDSLVDRFFSD